MKILPSSGPTWLALLLLPFKIFPAVGWLMLVIKRDIVGYRLDNLDLSPFVLFGDVLSFAVLSLAALIQYSAGARRECLWTVAFIIALFIFGYLTLPYLAHT